MDVVFDMFLQFLSDEFDLFESLVKFGLTVSQIVTECTNSLFPVICRAVVYGLNQVIVVLTEVYGGLENILEYGFLRFNFIESMNFELTHSHIIHEILILQTLLECLGLSILCGSL